MIVEIIDTAGKRWSVHPDDLILFELDEWRGRYCVRAANPGLYDQAKIKDEFCWNIETTHIVAWRRSE